MISGELSKIKDKLVAICNENMNDSDLELIHNYTTKDSDINSFFRYPVYLCDNDIDRDGECLSDGSLEAIGEMIVGKPGILGHEWEQLNNHSRIYKTLVYTDDEIKNHINNGFKCLIGFCYIPINKDTESFINKINTGVINEVSVGFKGSTYCSICGAEMIDGLCVKGHKALHTYETDGNKKLCYGYTDDIEDCFEWSFVSVPCMRNAGVIHTKKYKEDLKMNKKKEDTPMTLEEALVEIERLKKVIEDNDNNFKMYKKGCAIRKAVDSMGTVADKATELICKQLADVEGIEINDDGNIVSGEDIIKAVKDEMPFLFKEDTEDVETYTDGGMSKVEVDVTDETDDEDDDSVVYSDKYKGMSSTKFKSGNSNNTVTKAKVNKPIFGIKF